MSEAARTRDLPDGWRDRFIEILRDKAPEADLCVRCKTRLTLAEDAITPAIWKGSGAVMDLDTYPQAMLVCENCGDTSYFNLVALGMLDSEPEEV